MVILGSQGHVARTQNRISVQDCEVHQKNELTNLDQNNNSSRNLTEQCAKDNRIWVSFIFTRPNCLYTEYNSKLTLAPNSNKVLWVTWLSMTQYDWITRILKLWWDIALDDWIDLLSKNPLHFRFQFCVQRSFKNLT